MCLKMLQLLNSGAVYKVPEIAAFLETNTRNVIEYKKELEEIGYFINSIPGRYGGYQLEKRELIPSLKLSDIEKQALLESYKFIIGSSEFPYKEDYEKAMSIIFSSLTVDASGLPDTMFIERFPLAMDQKDLSYRYKEISNAIQKRKKVEIVYLSNDNINRNRIIHPYKLFMYNGAWFVLAWCELVCDFRYFKLCRIKEIAVLEKAFVLNSYYKEQDYLDDFGMKKQGEWIDVKLRFVGKASSYAKDYVYGKDQVVVECPDSSTIIVVKMQHKESLVKFVLGFAGECYVLRPTWLQKEVEEAAKKLLKTETDDDSLVKE